MARASRDGRHQLDQPFDEDRGLAGPRAGIDEHVALTLPNSRVALFLIGRRFFLGLGHSSGVLHWSQFQSGKICDGAARIVKQKTRTVVNSIAANRLEVTVATVFFVRRPRKLPLAEQIGCGLQPFTRGGLQSGLKVCAKEALAARSAKIGIASFDLLWQLPFS